MFHKELKCYLSKYIGGMPVRCPIFNGMFTILGCMPVRCPIFNEKLSTWVYACTLPYLKKKKKVLGECLYAALS